MALATDILNSNANLLPSREKLKRQPLSYPPTKPPAELKKERPKTPPGVSAMLIGDKFVFRACMTIDGKTKSVGDFGTPERAHLAYRLYRLWQRRGLLDIPTKPSIRTYNKR